MSHLEAPSLSDWVSVVCLWLCVIGCLSLCVCVCVRCCSAGWVNISSVRFIASFSAARQFVCSSADLNGNISEKNVTGASEENATRMKT